MYGLKFKVGEAIITCTKDRIDPKFAEVQSIYIIDNKLFLGVPLLELWNILNIIIHGLLINKNREY